MATDGTAFIAGGTSSADFPTAHSLQPSTGGPRDFPQDAFVSKISADGSALLYSTYLGGTEQDQANGIAVDTFGNAYVVGTTISPDYPGTAGAWDPNCSSDGECGATLPFRNGLVDSDGFLTKLNPAGSLIIYSGFIGGDEHDRALAVAVDTLVSMHDDDHDNRRHDDHDHDLPPVRPLPNDWQCVRSASWTHGRSP